MTKRSSSGKQSSGSKRNKSVRIRKKLIKFKKAHSGTLKNKATQKFKGSRIFDVKSNENMQLIKENVNNYSFKLSTNYLHTYAKEILNGILEEKSSSKRKIITENILKKFNLTKEQRKYVFRYLYEFTQMHRINIKCYFSALCIFDLFLINFAEDPLNEEEVCQTFFNSKKTNELSQTKVMLFALVCFSLACRYYNTSNISTEQLLEFKNAKNEVNSDDLIYLMDDIVLYTEADLGNRNIYYYIELFMFDLLQNMPKLTLNSKFLECFETNVIHYGARIVQDIKMNDIFDSIKAIAIIIFNYEFSKFICTENNPRLDNYMEQWKKNLIKIIGNSNLELIQSVIGWLNVHVSNY